MPAYRTEKYSIWRACERLNISPPLVKSRWSDNTEYLKAEILAYSQIREYEDNERLRL